MRILVFKITLLTFTFLISEYLFSQTVKERPPWDNQIYLGNKVTHGRDKWRFSGELQVRLKDNTQTLDYYFVEGVTSFLKSKHWEFAGDFRATIKPNEFEYRPGIGSLYKIYFGNLQVVNQVKWQADFSNKESFEHGLRYVGFLNYLIHDKYIPNFVAGVFYRWSDDLNAVQFIRFGPGLAFLFDVKHTLNISYFISAKNSGEYWMWSGIPVIQLIININKDYKYVPAKYFNF